MKVTVKFYNKKILMVLKENEVDQSIHSLCVDAISRMNEESKISSPDTQLVIYKNDVLLFNIDKTSDVLSNDDNISIFLNQKMKNNADSMEFISNPSKMINDDDRITIYLNGNDLKIDQLVQLGTGKYKIALSSEVWQLIKESRKVVTDKITIGDTVYGINTGFGKFATKIIPDDKLEELQINLIRSHASGVGELLSTTQVRMLMSLRINVLAKGYSGISVETLESVVNAFNKNCLPAVPEQGSVGASGDLAPLSHIVLGLLGEGKMWSPSTGLEDADIVLKKHDLDPIKLKAKEGLALINGTQMITALGAQAISMARNLALQADIIAALTVEVLKGNVTQFDHDIHASRPHRGQMEVAKRMRSLLHSDVYESKCYLGNEKERKVQDPYTMRCIPQVHGVSIDTIEFSTRLIETEMNSATDNPMIMKDRQILISGGNFHGEYPAKALDYLAIGVHELANISERRIERLVNTAYSEGLPSFLVLEGGINSGFMIAHCTAAALTSENKVLCHPSSSDTITTSGGTEDHVSMGAWSARKALNVITNVEKILAIELLAACQALEFFHINKMTSTPALEAVFNMVRKYIDPWKKDRYMSPDIEKASSLIHNNKLWSEVKDYMEKYNEIKGEDKSISCLLPVD